MKLCAVSSFHEMGVNRFRGVTIGLVLLLAVLRPAALRGEEWAVSSPANEGLDPEAFVQMDSHIRTTLPHVRSVLVARHGRLVFERYYGGASAQLLHNMQSMTKSITSALVGIALRNGQIASLDAHVTDYLGQYQGPATDSRARNITIRQLLTMTSGVAEISNFERASPSPLSFILAQPLLFAPGEQFRYSSAGAHLLGGVLQKATGRSVLEFATNELFRPLGIERFIWYGDKDGLRSGGLSGLFRSRDMLRFGELYLRDGKWEGQQLVPANFVKDSTQVHSSGDFYGEAARYGYMWWITQVDGHDAFYARGYGGQYLAIVRDADLVMLCTSDWTKPEFPEHFALMNRVVAAIKNGSTTSAVGVR